MTWGAVAVGAGTAVLGYMGQQDAASAQSAANRQNVAMSQAQIDEQARQFDVGQLESERRYGQQYGDLSQSKRDYMQNLLGGYSSGGQAAGQEQQAMLGLQGPEAQQAAYGNIQESPGQQFIRGRQEKALTRRAAATGGLQGGRVLTALQEQASGFASQDIDKQFGRLQALSGQGLQAGQAMGARDVGVLGGPQAPGAPGAQPGRMQGPGGPNLSMAGPQGGPAGGGYDPREGTLTGQKRLAAEEAAATPAAATPQKFSLKNMTPEQRRAFNKGLTGYKGGGYGGSSSAGNVGGVDPGGVGW